MMPKTNVLQEVHTTSASGDRYKKRHRQEEEKHQEELERRKNEFNAKKPIYHNKIIQQVCMETAREKMSKEEEMKSRGIGEKEEDSGRQRAARG